MRVFIYQRAKTAMQSGVAKTKDWVLEFDTGATRFVDPLMGWSGSVNTQEQLGLLFESKEAALAYAQKKGYTPELRTANSRKVKPKSYSANFAAGRIKYTDEGASA